MYHWSRTEIVLVFFTVTQPHRRSGPGARREQGKPPNATQRDETRIARVACRSGDKGRARKNAPTAPDGDAAPRGATRHGGRTQRPRDQVTPQAQHEPMPARTKDGQRNTPFCGHRRARATPAAAGETPNPSRQTEARQRPTQGGGHARTGNGARPHNANRRTHENARGRTAHPAAPFNNGERHKAAALGRARRRRTEPQAVPEGRRRACATASRRLRP